MNPEVASRQTASSVSPAPTLEHLRTAAQAILVCLALSSPGLAQSPHPTWQLSQTDGRFEGAHGTVQVESMGGTATAELRLGCATDDPTLPTLVLAGDRDFGHGPRTVYTRVLGISTTSENSWRAEGSELILSGFDAALLLSDLAETRSSRPFFMRLEGDERLAWSVPVTGMNEVLQELACAGSFN